MLVTNQVLLQAQQIEIEFPQKPGFSKAYNFESADNGGVYCRTEVARLDNLFWDDTLEWLMIKMVGNFQEPNHYDQEVLFAILRITYRNRPLLNVAGWMQEFTPKWPTSQPGMRFST